MYVYIYVCMYVYVYVYVYVYMYVYKSDRRPYSYSEVYWKLVLFQLLQSYIA